MKRWLVIALALIMTFSLAACGGQGDAPVPESADAQSEQQDAQDAATPDDSAAPEDSATPDDAAAPEDSATPDDAAAPDDNAAAEIANPFTDYATYEEAETAAGFRFGAPEQIGGYDTVSYRVAGTLFEVVYANDTASLTARKAPGGWDISGDYNQYTVEVAETLAGVNVTCWGEDDALFLAMWTADDYSYSLSASESMDRMDFLGTVETIISLNAA